MATCRRRLLLVCFLMGFQLCASLNREGAALLKLKETVDADPYGALTDWDEGSGSPCSWFGVECSGDGRVVALNLANLGLSGILPAEIGKLMHMRSLILRNNSFYGIIPTEIGNLQELKLLDLEYNNFNGPIPSELRNILPLEFRFLKGNRFSGGLPIELHEHTKICESQNQDITWLNRISGSRNLANAVTRRFLVSKPKDSLTNKIVASGSPTFASSLSKEKVITYPLMPPQHIPTEFFPPSGKSPPPPHIQSPPPPPPSEPITPPPVSPVKEQNATQDKKNNSSATIYALIGAVIGFVVIALSVVCFFYYCCKKNSTVVPLSATISSRQLQTTAMGGITLFRWSDLEKACEGFSNIIGTLPGFTLYKGTLPCGAEIAVVSTTVAYAGCWSTTAETHFMNKVEALSKVNHKNLMNLVGYYEDEKPFVRMMVFEYVSNGSLFERLHVKEAEHLSWQSRLRIAMGVLYCLHYMHQQNTPVCLRNLNSSCIYLTEDDAAKVSDVCFGVGDKEDEYDAPDEYSTVYKFALLLLETISGRCPYSNDDNLRVLWAQRYLTGASPVMDMIDPTLNSVPEEHVRAFSELIRLCISEDQRQRPTMAEVTKRMQEITGITREQAIPRKSGLWWAELEIITS